MTEENNNDVEITSSDYSESEIDSPERKPRSRERGPDKKPRTYRTNSMRNLEQFSNRPQEFQTFHRIDRLFLRIDTEKVICKTQLISN